MRFSNRLRATIAGACHAVGGMWAAAAVLRLVFGAAITIPLLPPLDLARVNVVPALATALGFFAGGALIGRQRRQEPAGEVASAPERSLPAPAAAPFTAHSPRAPEHARSASNQT